MNITLTDNEVKVLIDILERLKANHTKNDAPKGAEQEMIDTLIATDRLTTWEREFLTSLTDQLDRGRTQLSEKQIAVLGKIYNKKVLGLSE